MDILDILSVVMNMRNLKYLTQMKTMLYMVLAVLFLTVLLLVCLPRREAQMPFAAEENGRAQVSEETTDQPPAQSVSAAGEQIRTQTGQERASQTAVPVGALYRLAETDGKLAVYRLPENSLYMETDIAFALLPERLQTQIRAGKYFDSETSLYEFLESYSS